MEWTRFEVRRDEGIAHVWLNRPEKLNALDARMLEEFRVLFSDLQHDQAVRVVVLSGRGKAFCAGRDLKEKSENSILEGLTHNLMGMWGEALYGFLKPVVAAINGVCLGAGLDIALFSDIRLASRNALFGYPEVDYGMVVGSGGIQTLGRVVGAGAASYLALTGARIDAEKARELGLVTAVYDPDELLFHADRLAQAIAKKSPWALLYTKQILRQGWELTREASVRHDACVGALLRTTPERQAGIASFQTKEKQEKEK